MSAGSGKPFLKDAFILVWAAAAAAAFIFGFVLPKAASLF